MTYRDNPAGRRNERFEVAATVTDMARSADETVVRCEKLFANPQACSATCGRFAVASARATAETPLWRFGAGRYLITDVRSDCTWPAEWNHGGGVWV
jgi:hypothetical protein